MTDAWDDDEFEVPDLNGPPPAVGAEEEGGNWDDEEDFEPPPLSPEHGQAPKLSADKAAKKKKEADARRQADLQMALEENEDAGERHVRERTEIEEADHELTNELFDGGNSTVVVRQGLEAYELKNLKDHLKLAQDVVERFEVAKSKNNHVQSVIKELIKKLDHKLDVESLGEIIGICSASKTAKEAAIKRPTLKKEAAEQKAKAKGKTKTKAQKKEEQKAHADLFGGFVEDQYEDFSQEYDDFM